MNDRYPIEQLVQSVQTTFQSGFARTTMQRMPVFEGTALEPTPRGLKILGVNEMALAAPREFIPAFMSRKCGWQNPGCGRCATGKNCASPSCASA